MQLNEFLNNEITIGKHQKSGFVFNLEALEWAIKVVKNPLSREGSSHLFPTVNVVNKCSVGLTGSHLKSLPCAFNIVEGDFNVDSNELASFQNLPHSIGGWLDLNQNKITSLVGINKTIKRCHSIDLSRNPIEEGGLGLLLIENLRQVHAFKDGDFSKALEIIGKYLGQGKAGVLKCQEELEEAGLEKYAKI